MKGVSVLGLEINENEAKKAQIRAGRTRANIDVQTGDFLKWSLNNIRNNKSFYDAVVGNDHCNGRIAHISGNDPCPNLKECLHLDDAKALLEEVT